uniref:Uncharacterized protein n=1 Tax=Globodera rostochiensis TaxID=31243 RepID=A0A914IC75_GLORO
MEAVSSSNDDFRDRSTSVGSKKSNEENGRNSGEPSEWNKCIELLDKKKETDEKISQQVTLVANLGKAFDEGVQQDEGEGQEEKEVVPDSTLGNSEAELDTGTMRKHSVSHEQLQPNSSMTRARRSKRLYSPSPPPSLVGESGRKKKKEKLAEDGVNASVSSLSLQSAGTAPGSSLLKWARVPPSSSSLSSSLDSNEIAAALRDQQMPIAKENSLKKAREKSNLASEPAKVESVQNAHQSVSNDQSNIQLIRQNEKLARENVQLKQRNQEQQQQIQALIGANRELIWAFNESRREHDELMQQLRVMAKLVNGTSARPVALDSSCGTMQYEQNKKSVRPKQIGQKNVVGTATGGGGRQRKKQCTGMVYVAENSLPPSLAILKKTNLATQHTSTAPSEDIDQQPTAFDQTLSTTPNEQLMDRVQKEIVQSAERLHKTTSLIDRDEEINKIKQHLSKMAPDPNVNKLIGPRKPIFYTPKEYGDWRSVMSSISRKHIVLQLFEALCPEFTGSNVMELAKQNPSRADFIQKSLNFVFDAENELFVTSNSRDAYFAAIAEKTYTLREAKERRSVEKQRNNGTAERNGEAVRRRTLADVLKPKRVKPSEGGISDGAGADI